MFFQTNYKNRFSIFKYIFTVLNMYIMVTVTERKKFHSSGRWGPLWLCVVCVSVCVACVSKGLSEDVSQKLSQTVFLINQEIFKEEEMNKKQKPLTWCKTTAWQPNNVPKKVFVRVSGIHLRQKGDCPERTRRPPGGGKRSPDIH